MILQLVNSHQECYPEHLAADRLQQLDMSPSTYSHLRHFVRARAARESAIPEADVEVTVQFIVAHPDVGAGRAHLTLIDQEQALVGAVFINDARQEVARLAEEEYRLRGEREKLLEAELRVRLQDPRLYQHIQASHPHHIWATDFVVIRFLGFQLVGCMVYDIYSQAYLAIQAGVGCDQDLAQRTITAAVTAAGCRAGQVLRRDNGKAFLVESFQNTLADHDIEDAPIPPAKPWFNGSLESNNGSLKTAIKTTAMQQMPDEPARFQHARKDIDSAVQLLQQTCDRVRTSLNDQIARPKFAMPPGQVLAGQVDSTRQRQDRFVAQKTQERRQRMEVLRHNPDRADQGKTFIDKVRRAVHRIVKPMTTDCLYVFNEAIHRRFLAVET